MSIRGINIVNCNGRIINVFRKQIGTLHAELRRAKKKSEGFGVNRLTDKWRDQTYDLKLFYHELDNYLIGKENQDLRGDREEEDGIQRSSNRRKKVVLIL